jgi:hypothetical protein
MRQTHDRKGREMGNEDRKADSAVRQVMRGTDGPEQKLRAARALSARAEELLDETVREAVSAGMTWEEIGRAVGVSRQGAWKRWRR